MFIALRINRKGFLLFLSYDTDRGSRSSKGSMGSSPSYPFNPWKKRNQEYSRLSCYYQTPQLRQISLLSQEFWIVPQKRIGKSLLNEEKGIPLQPQTRKLHSETLTY